MRVEKECGKGFFTFFAQPGQLWRARCIYKNIARGYCRQHKPSWLLNLTFRFCEHSFAGPSKSPFKLLPIASERARWKAGLSLVGIPLGSKPWKVILFQ